jgi:chromate reductase
MNMSAFRIATIVGSLRRESFNQRFATALTLLGPPELEFRQLQIADLPLYNQDDDDNPSASVKRLKSEVAAAQGLIFITPEYNRSIPGILKNALDHGSRPYGQSVWAGRPAGIVGVSIGATGTAIAQQHLRVVLSYLDMPTLSQPEIYVQHKDELYASDGGVSDSTRKLMQTWMDRYATWVKQHAS